MRIATVHAHPDDAEILCGGTLALLAASGHEITIVTMTAGECGSAEASPAEVAQIRQRENAEAAQLIGAKYLCAGFPDLGVFNDDPSRRRVTEILRAVQPDVIFTAAPVDYHCDHEATSILVRDACFAASAPNYLTGAHNPAPALAAIPHLYYVDAVPGPNRFGFTPEPDFIVDVGSVFDLKKRMLSAHASQRAWLQRQHGMDDYIQTMEQWTRERGQVVGVEYGEGFRRYPAHPFPQTPLLEKLLSGRVILHSNRQHDLI